MFEPKIKFDRHSDHSGILSLGERQILISFLPIDPTGKIGDIQITGNVEKVEQNNFSVFLILKNSGIKNGSENQ